MMHFNVRAVTVQSV